MPAGKTRVIIDTNLWIRFLITGNFKHLDSLIENGVIEIIYSRELLEEFLHVVSRSKFVKFFSRSDVVNLLKRLRSCSGLIEVYSVTNLCRDSKDNFLLSLSRDSSANFLITADNDLLVLRNFRRTKIVTFAEFLQTIEEES